jgi:alpha,alpha-trehalose phosphorylase
MVHGFAGLRESGDHVRFAPRMPAQWERVRFHLRRHGSLIRVDLDHDGCDVTVLEGDGLVLRDGDQEMLITAGTSHHVATVSEAR